MNREDYVAALERHRKHMGLHHEVIAPEGAMWAGRLLDPRTEKLPIFCDAPTLRPDGVESVCGLPFGHGNHVKCDAGWDMPRPSPTVPEES